MKKKDLKINAISGNAPETQTIVHEYPTVIEWFKTLATNITNSWFTIGVAIFLVFVAFFFYYPSVGGDQDIWFHIRYGSHFVKNLTWQIDHGQLDSPCQFLSAKMRICN